RGAVGATTVRGRGNAGVVRAARAFLRTVDLNEFGTRRAATFASALDGATDELRASLPKTARHWGIARKVINLFIRDCLYNKYLNEAHALDRAEFLLELPLDSYTGKALVKIAPADTLPRWPGVKHLRPHVSAAFQLVAAHEAQRREIARVHLDGLW